VRNRLHSSYSKGRTPAERLEVVKLLVELGQDVNAADDYGITPLMVALTSGMFRHSNTSSTKAPILGAYDLGKKNDGAFGSSIRAPDADRLRDWCRNLSAEQRDRSSTKTRSS
jgi:hypothetical protein